MYLEKEQYTWHFRGWYGGNKKEDGKVDLHEAEIYKMGDLQSLCKRVSGFSC